MRTVPEIQAWLQDKFDELSADIIKNASESQSIGIEDMCQMVGQMQIIKKTQEYILTSDEDV